MSLKFYRVNNLTTARISKYLTGETSQSQTACQKLLHIKMIRLEDWVLRHTFQFNRLINVLLHIEIQVNAELKYILCNERKFNPEGR